MTTATDDERMDRALELAAVRALTPPNPWVGCVIEAADGTLFEGATPPSEARTPRRARSRRPVTTICAAPRPG